MKKNILRITGNNLVLPSLEILWFFLAYVGAFDFLMQGSSGLGFDIDWMFIFISQIIILFLHFFIITFKTKEKTNLVYHFLSSFGLLATLTFFMLELNFSFLIMVLSIMCYSVIYFVILTTMNRSMGEKN